MRVDRHGRYIRVIPSRCRQQDRVRRARGYRAHERGCEIPVHLSSALAANLDPALLYGEAVRTRDPGC